ncbi:MAG TPA: UDP-N-acetylmuramoyl-L-alanine--D-glutamate ligase [Xanthomonadaceae bacterium]|nr:UDP-N-acetylmuramoyl-L-alanine--D-glutamate ligase [Xanthomonadaceae bacterium]
MRISELDGQRVAIWGYGREGRAALAALRWRLPGRPLTVFCKDDEVAELKAQEDPTLVIRTDADAASLSSFDVIIKSPGISAYASPKIDAELNGVRFTSGTAIWFAENAGAHTVCVTGTKGKSTVTALVAFLLRAAGERTALAGNIGLPLLELLDVQPPPDAWAIELSSYQTGDAVRPAVAVVLNLFPEHLDWHGSEARYFADKLKLVTDAQPGIALLNGTDARLRELGERLAASGSKVHWFNTEDGWHVRDRWIMRGGRAVIDVKFLPLPGRHNWVNLCAALAAVEALGIDPVPLVERVVDFVPLPHRLQRIAEKDGLVYVNDSISTTPMASIAALDWYPGKGTAILVGGYDRGLDWGAFAERVAADAPGAIITMGQNGPAIFERLKSIATATKFVLRESTSMEEAVRYAQEALGSKGTVLLSPGAPSFPRYRDYAERGKHFAQAAGFDPEGISAIPGLGVR